MKAYPSLAVTLAAIAAAGILPEDVARNVDDKLGEKIIPPTFDEILAEIKKEISDASHSK